MANNVQTSVTVKGSKECIDFLEKAFNHEKCENDLSSKWLALTILDEEPENYYDFLDVKWAHHDDDYRENDTEYYFSLISAWYYPNGYIKNLLDKLLEIDENVIIEGKFEDETYNPIGAFYCKKGVFEEAEEDDMMYPEEDEEEDFDTALDEFYERVEDVKEELLKDLIEKNV